MIYCSLSPISNACMFFLWRRNLRKFDMYRFVRLENKKKAIFECSHHQILLKVGTLLHFSRCYTVVRRKLKLSLVTWFQISKNQFLTIFTDTPRPTLTCTYWRASLQCFFRDYYLLRNASKLEEKNRSYTFSQFDISSNWPSYSYTFNHEIRTKHNENFKLW